MPTAIPAKEPKFLTIREFRANLKQSVDSDAPTIIGNKWTPRALLLPIPRGNYHLTGQVRKTRAYLQRSARQAAGALDRS